VEGRTCQRVVATLGRLDCLKRKAVWMPFSAPWAAFAQTSLASRSSLPACSRQVRGSCFCFQLLLLHPDHHSGLRPIPLDGVAMVWAVEEGHDVLAYYIFARMLRSL